MGASPFRGSARRVRAGSLFRGISNGACATDPEHESHLARADVAPAVHATVGIRMAKTPGTHGGPAYRISLLFRQLFGGAQRHHRPVYPGPGRALPVRLSPQDRKSTRLNSSQ